MRAVYDDTGGIGKLYARQDEIGTPFCVTVDHESLEDSAVTVRDRDTWEQERVKILDLKEYLQKRLLDWDIRSTKNTGGRNANFEKNFVASTENNKELLSEFVFYDLLVNSLAALTKVLFVRR